MAPGGFARRRSVPRGAVQACRSTQTESFCIRSLTSFPATATRCTACRPSRRARGFRVLDRCTSREPMTITENTPTQLASAAVANGTAAQLEEVDSIPTVLLNRKIENAPPDGPRNPVMRALCNTGRLLSSCFRSASNGRRQCIRRRTRSGRRAAPADTLVLHLASGDAAATQLTTHCTQLGAAQREWQRVSPEASAQIEQSFGRPLPRFRPKRNGSSWMHWRTRN